MDKPLVHRDIIKDISNYGQDDHKKDLCPGDDGHIWIFMGLQLYEYILHGFNKIQKL
jgi:hypothetical protein